MKPKGKLGLATAVAVVAGTSVAMISVGTASASGGPNPLCGGCGVTGGGGGGGGGGVPGGGGGGGGGAGTSVLKVTDNCGGTLKFKESTAGTLSISITETDVSSTDTWSLQATQQEYGVTTGGRVGDPISLTPDTMGPLTYSVLDGTYTTSADIADTVNMTHGISYVATRTSPSPLTCTAQGFWTDHNGSTTPDPLNPLSKPDTAPAPTGNNVATSGANTTTIGFDQEMMTSPQGTPDADRFQVSVGGAIIPITAVQVTDSPTPGSAAVTLTLDSALQSGQTVSVQYRQPLSNTIAGLQDMDSLETTSFGVNIPVS